MNMGGPSSLDGESDGVGAFLTNLFSDPEIIPLGPLQKWLVRPFQFSYEFLTRNAALVGQNDFQAPHAPYPRSVRRHRREVAHSGLDKPAGQGNDQET